MLEYLNFFLLCTLFALILYLYSRVKRYLSILKMAEELIGNLGYETPQSDTKRQKCLECVLTGNTNQDALSEDLENDPFLNSALQRFTCELYYRFGSFLASLSVGIITSRHYLLSERNKNGERTSGTSGTSGTGDNKNGGEE